MAMLLSFPAQALDPERSLGQYTHTAWRNRDGLLLGAPAAIAQTTDGYIWIGTVTGLVRFDGIRFVTWRPPSGGPTLPSASINALLAATDGSLWIATKRGLARWANGVLQNYPTTQGNINAITEDPHGGIWISRTRLRSGEGPLCLIRDGKVSCFGEPQGLDEPYGEGLAIDSRENIWLGGEGVLVRWRNGVGKTFRPANDHAENHRVAVVALAASPDTGVWVGFFGSGNGLGLQRFEGSSWRSIVKPPFDSSQLQVSALFLDGAGSLWVGTHNQGMYRIREGMVDHFTTSDGLSGDNVCAFLEDREHNLWVATSGGIDSFRDLTVVNYTKREGLTGDEPNSIFAAADGTVWVGNVGGLDRLSHGVFSSVRINHGLPGSLVTALLVDGTNRLWIGVDDGLYRYDNVGFTPILDHSGRRSDVVTQLVQDADGSIWAASPGKDKRLLHIHGMTIDSADLEPGIRSIAADPHGGVWVNAGRTISHWRDGRREVIDIPPNFVIDYIEDMVSDSRGGLWAVTGTGVLLLEKHHARLLGESNGLPCASRGRVLFDSSGSLWLTQKCGLVKIDHEGLTFWQTHPTATVPVMLFDEFNGVQPGYAEFYPGISRGPDDRLWFVNGSTLQMLDPAHLHRNPFPPPVHVEALMADQRPVVLTKDPQLPPLTRDLEFDYTALSFVMPQRVLFRYQMEGLDHQWMEAGNRRSAYYSNLKPGRYRFLVSASNNDGVWNAVGASTSFVILPAWYQTWWARVIAVLVMSLVLYGLYLLRLRRFVTEMRLSFNERLDERTSIARNLHDTLLQTIQGSKLVADQARANVSDIEQTEVYLDRLAQWLDRASHEGRAALEFLRSPTLESSDIEGSIRNYIEEANTRRRSKVCLSVKGRTRDMHPMVSYEVYLIAQEAIRNALLHAASDSVHIELCFDRQLILKISDHGRGIDDETLRNGRSGHFGLAGMRERATRIRATIKISSDRGAGTVVTLTVPGKVIYKGIFGWTSYFRRVRDYN